jgi:hypothetical protein
VPSLQLIPVLAEKSSTAMGVRTAGSNFGMEETDAIPDKKFEGYSNLKGKSERQEKKATRAQNAKIADDLDIQYIDNLQKQIATMEL